MYCSLIPSRMQLTLSFRIHCAKLATNARFEHCVRPLRHTHKKQSFIFLDMQLLTPLMSLAVTDFPSRSWPIVGTHFFRVGTNISENFVSGGTNLRRSKLNMTGA